MALWANYSTFFGALAKEATLNITGSEYLTILIAIILLVCIAAMFKMPMSLFLPILSIAIIPTLAFMGEFRLAGGLFLITISIYIVNKLMFPT
jgi:hypothetical protein